MDSLLQAIELYYPKVRARFGFLLRDPDLADDLAQEVFARFLSALNAGHPVQDLWAYIVGIQHNVWLEHMRSKIRQPTPLDERIVDSSLATPAEAAEQKDLHAELHGLLEEFDLEEQALIIGRHFFGMTGQQLSDWLNVPRRTLVGRYNRAMERLRRLAIERGVTL